MVDVLDYTEPATRPGLSLVCTPGNDVEATTGKAASGATLILFTTGPVSYTHLDVYKRQS